MKYFVSFLSVSSLLLLGRLSGFLREWLMAFIGGADQTTDIAIVLITLPDLMVTLLIGGGFTAAIVPVLKASKPRRSYENVFTDTGIVYSGLHRYRSNSIGKLPRDHGVIVSKPFRVDYQ